VPIDSSLDAATESPAAADASQVEHCVVKRADGVYVDPKVLGTTVLAAIGSIFANNSYFSGLDYAVFNKVLYGNGVDDWPRSAAGEPQIRLASDIVPFDEKRRALYRAVKIDDGKAEYYFEPVYLTDPDNPASMAVPARLDVDEFVADMWLKGVRFGIDLAAVRSAIAAGKSERVTVARRLDALPGADASVAEVSVDIHRSDAPRQLANGKLDLMAFQNRFPQIHQGARLLKKVPRVAGTAGYELSGSVLEPAVPLDLELARLAGPGTAVEINAEGEFVVAQQTGFLDTDGATGQISVGDKIVSRDGVSSRTTGNLQLTGDYEEYGEVQEKRVIEGEGITIHADVFGSIVSRGGTILLNRNLVGGTAHNARGDIKVVGVASGAVIQASQGDVVIQRAESCIISGTRVTVEQAANCEIMAEEVVIKQAEGCAIAARNVTIGTAGPRKQSEMLIFALQPDRARVDEVIATLTLRVEQFGAQAARSKAEMEALTSEPEVRKYVMLASKIRKKELVLNPEQVPQFQKMAAAVGPALKAIAKVSLEVKAAEIEQQGAIALVNQLVEQRNASTGSSHVGVGMLQGETLVRSMKFNPDGSSTYDLPAKDIKARLRGSTVGGEVIFSGAHGTLDWTSEQ